MYGIKGIINFNEDIKKYQTKFSHMFCNDQFKTRKHALLAQGNNESLCTYTYNGTKYSIVFDGKIYNKDNIMQTLISKGYHLEHTSDSYVALLNYIDQKHHCVDHLEGAFSFVVYSNKEVFGCRDHLGVKPLYYSHKENTLVFASTIKSILSYLEYAIVNQTGLLELLGLGPSTTPGKTIYKDILSLRPGHYFTFTKSGLQIKRYFKLKAKQHQDDYQTTKSTVRNLLVESIMHQLDSKHEVASMLSGGVDSSIISSICTNFNPNLDTYSITYEDEEKNFKANEYQTSRDDYYIDLIVNKYNTNHHKIVLTQEDLINHLKEALIARDMPGMADIDSSFYCFSKLISKQHQVVLSGECADEIFGGYPWFYKEELYSRDGFPWLLDLDKRISLLKDNIKELPIQEYVQNAYQNTMSEIEYTNDNPIDRRKQKMIYLCSEWFMQNLLTRGNTQTAMANIECRVPFASKKLIEYVYNIPWDYLYQDNQEKALLRDAFQNELPDQILHRKKNPYPKTHSPIYTNMITKLLQDSLQDDQNILLQLFDIEALNQLIKTKGDSFKYPWFGQLMMGPQFIAYLYQIYLWGKLYHIQLEI